MPAAIWLPHGQQSHQIGAIATHQRTAADQQFQQYCRKQQFNGEFKQLSEQFDKQLQPALLRPK